MGYGAYITSLVSRLVKRVEDMLVVITSGSGFVFIHLTSCLYFCNSILKSWYGYRSILVIVVKTLT